MRCAISQPTFLPWLGWFDIFDQADEMVLLDTVQFEKRSWQQRNRIRSSEGLLMISVPVLTKGRSTQSVREVRLADPSFGDKLLRTLRTNYAKAPHFAPVFDEVATAVPGLMEEGRLSALNEGIISIIARWLGITTPLRRASELSASGTRGEYLANLCQEVGATEYLSTMGAREYLLDDLGHFSSRSLTVLMHDYHHPGYAQLHEPFLENASAIDLVMMHGEESGSILRASAGKWKPLTPELTRQSRAMQGVQGD
jgi:hypothetical protein